jgi:hypothetical protein
MRLSVLAELFMRRDTMKRLAIAAMLGIATALLACGCMWGHVYDAETGLDVPGATVSWVDAQGNSGSETTGLFWAPGLYVFCGYDLIPHYNPITFTVTAPGYMPLVAHRDLSWDDGPYDGGFPTCDELWDVQDFSLMPLPGTSGLLPQPSPSPVPTPTATPTLAHRTRPTPTPTPKPGIMVR